MTTSERRIVVTGANKGIGKAIVERILDEHAETFVFLGSRDEDRGAAARDELVAAHPDWKSRLEVLVLDVSDDASVTAAAKSVAERFPGETKPLYGIVNNAGIGLGEHDLADVLAVNAYGPHRVQEAFGSLVHEGGRVVIVTSAAGPNFVAECSEEMQRFFTRDEIAWSDLDALMKEAIELGSEEAFEARGLSDGSPYGLSKACANAYMRILARERPDLRVNACTPGFIETDLTRSYAASQGKAPEELGMKSPKDGARTPVHLLFADLDGNGWYYGSDAERSPLDRYRSPGDPPYEGD